MGSIIYFFSFLLAFCSIVYELLLGQSLAAFMGNTVLRYSVTIGLYMMSMGIGALLAEGRFIKQPVITLLQVEIGLTITGGFSVLLLLLLSTFNLPDLLFSGLAHLLIIIIGILTGFEIPLLIELRNLEQHDKELSVLGVDYLGAFFGTIVFAFLFYPAIGLIKSAFMVAFINAFVGVCLLSQWQKVHAQQRSRFHKLLGLQAILFVVLILCIGSADSINELFLMQYLSM